ncbi:hypothetical protein BKP35_16060 [Anaerobacillus arseniciselenatis]|uniref:Uncharacterized protein n=1 Tax=Anaerobacillus arseniciselenatis TaxID=85682 RepID=A0A1S2LD51_9BACI|nr:hypothetical protein [Anaerobacillus arseniciselenatis]OIJ09993.1 hypothetical protein BKP35_16060 [Anaerobacillus arseniciselenatis]
MNIKWLTESISDYYFEILKMSGELIVDESDINQLATEKSEYVIMISDSIKEKFEQSFQHYFLNIGIDLDTNKLIMDMERDKGVRIRSDIYPYRVNNIISNERLVKNLLSFVGDQRKFYFDFLEEEWRFLSEVIER